MRDPKRIPNVLAVVQKAWEKNPDLRLGQLLINLLEGYETGEDLFYMQDDALVGLLTLQYGVEATPLSPFTDLTAEWRREPQNTAEAQEARIKRQCADALERFLAMRFLK